MILLAMYSVVPLSDKLCKFEKLFMSLIDWLKMMNCPVPCTLYVNFDVFYIFSITFRKSQARKFQTFQSGTWVQLNG